MTLPTIHEVTSMFLYGTVTPPTNFVNESFVASRDNGKISISTDEFLNTETGAGRFVVASNSAMIERFFETAAADYAAGVFGAEPGIVSLTKAELNEIYGLNYFGIIVDNKEIYDELDDYASRVYIYGHIELVISEDARFTIYPDGRLEILNFSLSVKSGDDFDFLGGDGITTVGGSAILEPAIDPSRIGKTVKFQFDDATSYTYTQASYSADVTRADSFSTASTVESLLFASRAMGGVIRDLYDEGTINTTYDGKLILYGSDQADEINGYVSRIGVNVSEIPGVTSPFPNPLHEVAQDGLVYLAGAGNDTINGTSSADMIIGGDGADNLFGGAGDDFIFFDAQDTTVNGGAGRDAAWIVSNSGVTADMTAM